MTRKEIEKKLDNSPQYHFERDEFCKAFDAVFGNDFDVYELFGTSNYKTFDLWYDEDTWYIYSKELDIAVSWYKGLGRINQCTFENLDLVGLKTMLMTLGKEYQEIKEKER